MSRRVVYSASSLYRAVCVYRHMIAEMNSKSSFQITDPLLTSSGAGVIAIPSNMPPSMILNNACESVYNECVSSNNCICGRAFNDDRVPVAINIYWRYPGTAFQIANRLGNGLFLSNGRLIGIDLETKKICIDEPVDVEWI
jgi:hypothetical protein